MARNVITRIIIEDCDIAVLLMDCLAGSDIIKTDTYAKLLAGKLAHEVITNSPNASIKIHNVTSGDNITVYRALLGIEDDVRAPLELLTYIFNNLDKVHTHRCFSRAIVEFGDGEHRSRCS